MDDLLVEFLEETTESIDVVDAEMVRFEQDPNDTEILDNIFRLVHTIKGTCGFLGLPRLASLAHAAENLMGQYRDGAVVTKHGVTLILATMDRLKEILAALEEAGAEPEGDDKELIAELDAAAISSNEAVAETASELSEQHNIPQVPEEPYQTLERDLKPGEVSLEDLERAFREAEGPDDADVIAASPEPISSPAVQQMPEPAKTSQTKPKEPKENKATAKSLAKGDATVKNQTLRVNVETLEHLMNMVSELVLTRNQLLEMVRDTDDSEFNVPLQRLSNVTAELQEGVMKTRMQPIGNAWQKLPRIVRDLANELGKKIDLEMIGAETELDRQVLDVIKDPLTHMVRNSADHGLEDNADRVQLGKPEVGKITLSAYHEGGQIIIEIDDDGKGLDADKIKAKAIESGFATEAELRKMSENQVHKLVFHPGLSTAKKVTSVSGRGVGMDVVRTNIELIGGVVDVRSRPGKGSTFIIKIPLTLAIVSALILESGGQRFALPQLSVVELVRSRPGSEYRIEMINNTAVLRLRNKLLPLVSLNKLLNITPLTGEENRHPVSIDEGAFIIVTQVGAQNFGIIVDSIFHTEEIVVKPMSSMLRDISMFSGNTILGDGSVIMIIDPNGVAQKVADDVSQGPAAEIAEAEHGVHSETATTMLLFKAGSDALKAVPLSLVTRLEEIPIENIENSNGRDLVQYRGALMPLVYINAAAGHKTDGNQPILVFTDQDRSMGLVVDEIVDIVEEHLNIEVSSSNQTIMGSAVISGHATEIIDVAHYLPQAFGDWLERKDQRRYTGRKNMRLLLVDDSAFFRGMLSPLLSSAGYQVTLADSAEDALAIKEKGGRFDLIVSDIEMPGMNGIEFAERLRNDVDWGDTPIIALSSHAEPDIIERSRKAGFIDYIGKFDREGLIKTLTEQRGAA
jgi:two-component system chemotaxis sensor kinase CheA